MSHVISSQQIETPLSLESLTLDSGHTTSTTLNIHTQRPQQPQRPTYLNDPSLARPRQQLVPDSQ